MANRHKQPLKHGKAQATKPYLPLFFVLGGVIVLAVAVFFGLQSKTKPFTPQVTGGPSLQVDQDQVDLGNEKLGNTVAVSFRLQNVGDQSLRFTDAPYIEVKEGC